MSSSRHAWWLKNLHQWHWISAALCLVAMLLFSVTGITLNHAAQITVEPHITQHHATLPEPLRMQLQQLAKGEGASVVPDEFKRWLRDTLAVRVTEQQPEWSDEELYISLPRPGGDAWLRVDLTDGATEYELTDRGWISYLNDLHKGRNTGTAWRWFIDVFAVATLVFAITGLFILKFHAANRPATWPVIGLGLVLPLLLALLFIH